MTIIILNTRPNKRIFRIISIDNLRPAAVGISIIIADKTCRINEKIIIRIAFSQIPVAVNQGHLAEMLTTAIGIAVTAQLAPDTGTSNIGIRIFQRHQPFQTQPGSVKLYIRSLISCNKSCHIAATAIHIHRSKIIIISCRLEGGMN